MKNKILCAIGAIWGAGIIINWFLSEPAGGSTAYRSGQLTAVVLGVLLLGFSVYNFFKEPKESS